MKKIIRNIIILVVGVSSWTYANCYFHKNDIKPQQEFDLKASINRGNALYQANCTSCHMATGEGIPSVYPPLAESTNIKDEAYVINGVKNGINGAITVNGIAYNSMMPGVSLSDKEIADVLNYVRNSFGNTYKVITPETVTKYLAKK